MHDLRNPNRLHPLPEDEYLANGLLRVLANISEPNIDVVLKVRIISVS